MAQNQIKEADIMVLMAAIQNSVGPIQVPYSHQVDAEKVAKQLGMSLSTIPPKFTAIRKRYNIDIKVINSGALQRNRQNSPKKRLSNAGGPKQTVRLLNNSHHNYHHGGGPPAIGEEICLQRDVAQPQGTL
ncbi:hypothetical protein G647_03513 [Cladophialophora carrionii CBS 160.54]|uniref:Uncharacterized protein n=1 Tax=Cladophialophora carrionii CBS 160.54 TaxID=1279043 RepID=V9DB54_9EURO|nr:uncharacterized protein G647_03513 [Cladophialophora carrionii CBS 160.54]ETI24144.1 hypothetical protein G647_03513 [Cladophialophora carrionii CBS 160.54]